MDDPARGFDFLEGEWDAVCRVPTDGGWEEAKGSLTASRTLGGALFLERFEGLYHGGRVEGLGLRAFNRGTGEWEHTWSDTLAPAPFRVWRGAFDGNRIDLFAEWIENGAPVRSRLTWSAITADSAHWESARSNDGGKRWQIHWMIEFRKKR